MSKLMNLKARYFLIFFLIMVVVDVLLCIYAFYSPNKTLNTVLLISGFLLTGIFFDVFIQKVLTKRQIEKLYKEKRYSFENKEDSLSDFSKRSYPYGNIYSKVIGTCLYKITYIKNINEYHTFDPSKYKNEETPGIKRAKAMVGVEIFLEYDDELKKNIRNYSIATERVMYTAMYLENNTLIEANHLEEANKLQDDFKKVLEMAGVIDEEDNTL